MKVVVKFIIGFIIIGAVISAIFECFDSPTSSNNYPKASTYTSSTNNSKYTTNNNKTYTPYYPTSRNTTSDYKKSCSYCNGKGRYDCTDPKCLNGTCSECGGDGIYFSTYLGNSHYMNCTYCNNGRCDTCGGTGTIDCRHC